MLMQRNNAIDGKTELHYDDVKTQVILIRIL